MSSEGVIRMKRYLSLFFLPSFLLLFGCASFYSQRIPQTLERPRTCQEFFERLDEKVEGSGCQGCVRLFCSRVSLSSYQSVSLSFEGKIEGRQGEGCLGPMDATARSSVQEERNQQPTRQFGSRSRIKRDRPSRSEAIVRPGGIVFFRALQSRYRSTGFLCSP